ncbi:MAG: class I SAM-dependent methyltransferase, partial [Janthinobacterium lividum]
VEIWPGNGWYTEILAPLLNAHGLLYEALPEEAVSGTTAAVASTKATVAFSSKMAAAPAVYGKVVIVPFAPPGFTDIKPPGGADLVLTFRNVHNWLKAGSSDAVFAAMFAALKPGGVLGVVEHRARPGTSLQKMIDTGYMTEDYVIQHAQAAGFRLVARSEINANPQDTTDHPNGVWSLPPALAGGTVDRQQFLDIGESDRMTLRFEKPR